MNLLITLVLVYLIGMPILLRLITYLHYKVITQRQLEKNAKNRVNKEVKILWQTWKEPLFYTLRDKQNLQKKTKDENGKTKYVDMNIQKRQVFFIIYVIGLLITVVAYFTTMWSLLALSYFVFFVAVTFAILSPKKLLAERKKIMEQMLKIARNRLNIPADMPLNEVVIVLEWLDPVTPSKVQFYVPSTFAQSGCASFLEQFNQVFGQESAWVAFDDPETGEPGWNFKLEKATFYSVPPLPQIAKWDEHYVVNERIAWSFFPIGLGVENGVEMTNPKTGEQEFIIGFDLFGEQKGMEKKFPDIKVATILGTAAPMALIAGGTGSGKSVPVNTKVAVVIDE